MSVGDGGKIDVSGRLWKSDVFFLSRSRPRFCLLRRFRVSLRSGSGANFSWEVGNRGVAKFQWGTGAWKFKVGSSGAWWIFNGESGAPSIAIDSTIARGVRPSIIILHASRNPPTLVEGSLQQQRQRPRSVDSLSDPLIGGPLSQF